MVTKISLFILLFILTLRGFSQKNEGSVKLISETGKDAVKLRWAPNKPIYWQYGNQYGYIVERYTFVEKGKQMDTLLKTKKTLTPKALKLSPLEDYIKHSDNDKFVAIAAEALYGEQFTPEIKGNDINTIINKSKEIDNRYSFALFAADQSILAASLMGLCLIDSTIQPNSRYLYRVFINSKDSSLKTDTGFVFINTDEINSLPKPKDLYAESNNHNVHINWNRRFFDQSYSSWFIERSGDSAKTFISLNKDPFVNPVENLQNTPDQYLFIDTIAILEKRYCYRIWGKSYFGEPGPYSDTICVHMKQQLKSLPKIISANTLQNRYIKLKWTFDESETKLIKGFNIKIKREEPDKYSQVNQSMLSVTAREYMLETEWLLNFIVVAVVDRDGLEHESSYVNAYLYDSIPPAPPTGISGFIDTTGMVRMKWTANKEQDIEGYRVFAANNPGEEFSQITNESLKEPIFTDSLTLNTLSRKIYYRVVAVDKRYNRSKFSETVLLVKPDKIAPPAPSFTDILSTDTCLHIWWKSSGAEDVAKHILYRKTVTDDKKNIISIFNKYSSENHYVDCSILPGIEYEYYLTAIDSSNNTSPLSSPVSLKLIENKNKPAIQNFSGIADREKKQIICTWNYPLSNIAKFQIFRALPDIPLQLWYVSSGIDNEFIDKNLQLNTKYVYRIRAIFKTGEMSKLSKEVVVNY